MPVLDKCYPALVEDLESRGLLDSTLIVVISLDPIEVIAGSLPRRQCRLAEAWAELHQEELIAD